MNIHNTHKTLLLCACIVGALLPRAEAIETFVRPAALYLDYTESRFSSEMGASVAVGTVLGEDRKHEVSVEVGQIPWKLSGLDVLGPDNATGSGHLTPMLVNYRYCMGTAAARVRFYGGASVGATRFEGDLKGSFSGRPDYYAGSVSKTETTFGGGIGLMGNLTKTLSYDFGYRFSHTAGFDVSSTIYSVKTGTPSSAGQKIPLPATSAHIFALSVSVRF